MPFRALGARLLLLLCLLGAWASVSGQERNMAAREAQAAPRVALVVGNGAYAEAPLRNALNDARGMVAALQGMGFEVQLLENGDLQQMDQAVREFGRRLRSAKVGLFYYAGHALQIRGRNYLIPLGARFEQEDEVAYRSLDVGQVLDKMDSARTPTNLMILDACRTNPFQKYFRASRHGLTCGQR